MLRQMLIFLVPLVLLIGTPANANVEEWSQEKNRIELQRAKLKTQMTEEEKKITFLIPDQEKERILNKQIKLGMAENKLAAYQRTYEIAINYVQPGQSQQIAAAQYFNLPVIKIKPGQKVPGEFIPIYKAAGETFGVDWFVLAAIHSIETNFSQIQSMISTAGAIGHMQFMPATFAAYGVDGNGDGLRNAWSLEDSIFSAANYLLASGYKTDVRKAIWHYNHAEWYVNDVLARAARIKNG